MIGIQGDAPDDVDKLGLERRATDESAVAVINQADVQVSKRVR